MNENNLNSRQRFLAAGRELYTLLGYRDLSIRRLAQQVGLSPGSFHHLFTSKDEFLVEVLDQIYQEALGLLTSQVQRRRGSVRAKLASYLFFLADFARQNSRLIRRIFEDSVEAPAVLRFIQQRATGHMSILFVLLERATARKLLKPSNLAQRSAFLINAVLGPLLLGRCMLEASILPEQIAMDFDRQVESDVAINQRIDWALTAIFKDKEPS